MVYGLLIHSVTNSELVYFSSFYTPEGNDSTKKAREQMIIRRILEEHQFLTHSYTFRKEQLLKLRSVQSNFEHNNSIPTFDYNSSSKNEEDVARFDAATRCVQERLLDFARPSAREKSASPIVNLFDHMTNFTSLADPGCQDPNYTEGVLRIGLNPGSKNSYKNSGFLLDNSTKLVVWKHANGIVYTLILEPLDNPLLGKNFLTLFIHEVYRRFSHKRETIIDNESALKKDDTAESSEDCAPKPYQLPPRASITMGSTTLLIEESILREALVLRKIKVGKFGVF